MDKARLKSGKGDTNKPHGRFAVNLALILRIAVEFLLSFPFLNFSIQLSNR